MDLWKKTGECFLCRTEIESVLEIDVNSKFREYLKVISETFLEPEIELNDFSNMREFFEFDLLNSFVPGEDEQPIDFNY